MIKQLKLYKKIGRFTDNIDYVICDNDKLEIKIITEFGANTELYAIIGEKHIKIKNKHFIIDKDLLKVGECAIIIVAVNNNVEVGRYICTPIIVKELDNEYATIDEITLFKKQIEEQEKEMIEFKNNIIAKIEKMQELIKSMINME